MSRIRKLTWQETAADYFDHHETLNEANRQWLKANVELDCDLLQGMQREALLQKFSLPQGFSASRLNRTLVWQTMARILCGDVEPLGGNVRSFYYSYGDPLFNKFNLYKKVHLDPAFQAYVQGLSEEFPYERYTVAELVDFKGVRKSYIQDDCEDALRDFTVQRIFQYSGPFAFPDPGAAHKLIGTKAAGLLFVLEKEGLFDLYCKGEDGFNKKLGISVMASHGNPSWVSMEYLAHQLEARGVKNIHLAALVDYDYGGWGIADDYAHKIQAFGFNLKSNTNLTKLNLFTEEDLRDNSDDLSHEKSKSAQTRADRWFKKTGGIDGREAGIHINLAQPDRVRKAVKAWAKLHAPKGEFDGR